MSNINLAVSWQAPKTRKWIPIGHLSYNNQQYEFYYTNGVKEAQEQGFYPFARMNDLESLYTSEDVLLPVFANRLLSKSRPEYKLYQQWLGLDEHSTPLDELARNNGIRATDSIELYLIPNDKKEYKIDFFTHGISHLIPSYQKRVKSLEPKEKLYLMRDIQNEYDSDALLIRTKDPVEIVGYVPRIYAEDLANLIHYDNICNVTLRVKQVNHDAPMQFQLLCEFCAKIPNNFKSSFEKKEYFSKYQAY
ncbi:restriction endonuclease [Helicobacter sp. MIT 05-5293]|uniref:HIRAN domain-containing protein n=1 Tax=unclassified Helicobacter TaxID=2593540 RepID=UPI00051E0FCA|nr:MULTISPECIES: HIRAN domain-containing protein [unclassified Helicobacter]TLD79855.1 restriction endonuclease [Helicobacter sp. MIT 05-5293]TLD85528.1 restriction endonuclease [Helicobacter sp. MIT 05-5294]